MTILITGSTGQTGSRLASILHAAGQPIVVASRSGVVPSSLTDTQNVHAVKFDWLDSTTFLNPFTTLPSSFPPIDRVYLLTAVRGVDDLLSVTKPFIDLAVTKGVKRFVLLSATTFEKGGPVGLWVNIFLPSSCFPLIAEVFFLQKTSPRVVSNLSSKTTKFEPPRRKEE